MARSPPRPAASAAATTGAGSAPGPRSCCRWTGHLGVVPPDPSVHIRAAELQHSRLQREREDLAAGKVRYRDHPVAHPISELHQAGVNVGRRERSLAESRPAPGHPRGMALRVAGWRSRSAPAARAVKELSAPNSPASTELDERLSGRWTQRETHQRWADDHPEASHRLDDLAADIDVLDAPSRSQPLGP